MMDIRRFIILFYFCVCLKFFITKKQDTGFYFFTFGNYGLWQITALIQKFGFLMNSKPHMEMTWKLIGDWAKEA